MRKIRTRALSLLLTLVMVLGLLPGTAWAEEAPTFASFFANIPATAEQPAGASTSSTRWSVQEKDGGYVLRSPNSHTYSARAITLTFSAATHFTFEFKVDSGSQYNYLYVAKNENELTEASTEYGGSVDWTRFEMDVSAGDVVEIGYYRGASYVANPGENRVWLRNFSAGAPLTITFHDGDDRATQAIYGGTGTLKPNPFTKSGYVFAGWATTSGGDAVYEDGASITISENTDLYAVWAEAYTVTFQDGDSSIPVYVAKGEPIGDTKIQTPDSRTGYTFGGWFNGDSQLTAETVITDDIIYTAKWTPITYTIRFDANDGTGVMADLTATYDEPITLTQNTFTREGYTFQGWRTNRTWGSTYNDQDQVSNLTTEDGAVVTLYAQWAGNPVTVTLNYGYDNNTEEKSCTVGSYYGVSTPSRDGYLFDGWYTAAEGGTKVTSYTTVTNSQPHTLYARWTKAVTITFDANGGSCYTPSKMIPEGSSYGTLPSATKSGYKFDGWYTAAEGGEKVDAATVFWENTTLYAHYRAYRVTLSFDANGGEGTMADVICANGETITLPKCTFTREGYQFLKWADSISSWGIPTYYEDEGKFTGSASYSDTSKKLYALWQGSPVTVTLNYGYEGQEDGSCTLRLGEEYVLPIPQREGYLFAGWYTAAEGGQEVTAGTLVTEPKDHTLYARWLQLVKVESVLEGWADVTYSSTGSVSGDPFVYVVKDGEACLSSNNVKVSSSSVTVSFTFEKDGFFTFDYAMDAEGGYSSYSAYDYMTISYDGEETKLTDKNNPVWHTYQAEVQAGKTLTVKYQKDSSTDIGEDRIWLKNFKIKPLGAEGDLLTAIEKLGEWYNLYPVFGEDTNVADMVAEDLADLGMGDIAVSFQSAAATNGTDESSGIGQDGTITYFYADPNGFRGQWSGTYNAAFTLTKEDAQVTLSDVPVVIYWDVGKVRETMTGEILDKVTEETIVAEGNTAASVTKDLSLPRTVDDKLWTQISWESSDPDTISISSKNQTTADTLFAPYVGEVKQGEEDKEVTLTATFTFQRTNDSNGGEEAPITMSKVFRVTVKALGDDQRAQIEQELLAKLDQGFAAKGLTDALTGEVLPLEGGVYTAVNDIQLPTTRDFGVDGKYMPVTLSSGNAEVIQAPDVNNAARFWVYRPGVGEKAEEVTITVTLHDDETSVTASRSFPINVPALTQAEIEAELALMETVKANYFNGIRGENEAIDNITTDLSPFQEVYEDDNGELVWVRDVKDRKGRGIVPTPIEGWEELEAWRLFKSSNPNVISHENLLVTRQTNPKSVTITSFLSSETLGKYGELYQSDPEKYAKYEDLDGLYYQEVTADTAQAAAPAARAAANEAALPGLKLLVRGTADPASTTAVVDTIDNVTFSLSGLDGEEWIGTTTRSGLSETYTVYDLFTEMLDEYGYTAERSRGTYIVSISGPEGSLREKEHGEDSGWMYRVNGKFPDVYMGSCSLHSGDDIQVFYTEDASKVDPDYHRPSGGGASGGKEEGGQTSVEVEENKADGTYTVTLPEDSEGLQRVVISQAEADKLVVIVHADGREEVVKKSLVSDGKAVFLLEEGATVKLVDYESAFSDVADGAWYSSAVDFVAGRGLFSGVSEDQFAPGQTLSRGMLATVLFQLEEPESKRADLPFDDVAEGAWYAQGVAWAAGEKVISGYGDGRFGPNDPITREQLALMLFRYAETLDMATSGRDTLTSFTDSGSVSPWAREAVAWAVDSGILSGRPDGTLAPGGTATRAEAAVMLRQLIALMLR